MQSWRASEMAGLEGRGRGEASRRAPLCSGFRRGGGPVGLEHLEQEACELISCWRNSKLSFAFARPDWVTKNLVIAEQGLFCL